MNTSAPCAQDFYEILANKEGLIGRDFQLSELGMVYRGPITGIRVTSTNCVIITLGWLARKMTIANQDHWAVTRDHAVEYDVPCDNLRSMVDGTIVVTRLNAWRGVIQPADSQRLPKPALFSSARR